VPSIDKIGDPALSQKGTPSRKAIVSFGSVIVLGLVCLWLSFWIIPRFAGIFRDMLDGQPLPPLTVFVLNSRWWLVVFDCICLLSASFVVRFRASSAYLFAILFIMVGQVSMTMIGLFTPLIGTIVKLTSPH
jgi:type II secretory pathway component PulF